MTSFPSAVPESIDAATKVLEGVGGLLSAGHWGTSAIVWAFTREGTNQHEVPDEKSSSTFTISDFAAMGIRGLKTRDSVRKYRSTWQRAIDNGCAEPTGLGITAE